jgi:hypothetical protein
MKLRTRLQRLERRAASLPAPHPVECPDDEFAVWCRGGCLGPLPSGGPRPALYGSDEAWQQHRRYLLALCCREVGRPDPPGMSDEERREVDETIAFVASLDWTDQRSMSQQAHRESDASVIEQPSTDSSGRTVPTIHSRGESL